MTHPKRAGLAALVTMLALSIACAQGNLPQPVQAAISDLAQRLEMDPEGIAVARMEEVTWPDASLGAPEPGQMYAQVQTPGYRVVLHAQGQRYEYHTDMGTRVTLVGDGPQTGPGSPEQEEIMTRLGMIAQARRHLSRELGVDESAIFLAAVEQVTWPDLSLGFPRPGEAYIQQRTQGYRLVFEAAGELHEYHTDRAGLIRARDGSVVTERITSAPPDTSARPAVVQDAMADLASRLGIAATQISVASVEDVDWPNAALGLPEPGMMYTQAIVPGQRIILEALGRTYAYHSGRHAVRYAGIVYPEDATVSVYALQRTEPADGNNFFHLQKVDPQTGEGEVIVPFISDFATTPDGRDIVVASRASRSHHLLVATNPGGEKVQLDSAFDFGEMALSDDGRRLAYWARPGLQQEHRLYVRYMAEDSAREIALPGLDSGRYTGRGLVWNRDGLAISVETADGPRSFWWDGETVRPLGDFSVVGAIPRASTLVILRAEGNRDVLAAFMPGEGETTIFTEARDLQSVAVPAGEQYLLAIAGDGGAPELRRITWGGATESLGSIVGAERAVVNVSPVGEIAAVSYEKEEGFLSDVLSLSGGTAQLLTTINEPGVAVPVAN